MRELSYQVSIVKVKVAVTATFSLNQSVAETSSFIACPSLLDSYAPHEGVDPEALDPEIQQEFEAFIEEIEEHLMMQEFGPEPEAEEQQDTATN